MSVIKKVNFVDGFNSEVVPSDDIIGASSFLVGTGVPSSGLGNDGDVYLDSATGDLYVKAAGTWSVDSTLSLPASGIVNTPSGDIVATDVQAAIDELDTEKLAIAGGTITGNLTVSGDLQVDGTTTTLNTTNLDVEDANITINNGGTQASADSSDAGITVEMSDATDAVIGYDSTTTSKFKIGEVGSEIEVADISSSQVIINKDIDGGTASNTSRLTIPKDTTTNLDALTDKEATLGYDTTTNQLVINDGVTWSNVASGLSTGVVVEGRDNGGTVLTANTTNIDFTETRDTASTWDGSIFTASEDGDHSFVGAVIVNAVSTARISAYVDTGGGFSSLQGVSSDNSSRTKVFVTTIYLDAGDKVSFRSNMADTLTTANSNHYIHIIRLR